MSSALSSAAAPLLGHFPSSPCSLKSPALVKDCTSFQVPSHRNEPQNTVYTAHSTLTITRRRRRRNSNLICTADKEYKFPDPIPEFADSGTEKFRTHLHKKLSKKDMFGDSVDEVVGICTEIFSEFLHSEYGGPGTLLVVPFIDMADTLNERGLPSGPQAARAAVKWARAHVDKDWKEWTSS